MAVQDLYGADSQVVEYLTQTPALDIASLSIPWFNLGSLAFDIIGKLLGIPDPLDLILSLFSGRPTMEATIDASKTLKNYSSAPLALMAIGAADLVNRGIPLSSPAADPIFGQYFAAAVIVEQAVRWSNFTPQLAAIEAATMKQALYEASNPNIAGPATLIAVQQAWNAAQNDATVLGAMTTLSQTQLTDPASQLAKGVASRFVAQHTPTTPSPSPTTTPGPQPTPTPAPTTTPGPQSSIPPQYPFDPNGDELSDIGYALSAQLNYLLTALGSAGNQNEQQCCVMVVGWLTLIQTSLENIHDTLGASTVNTALHNIRLGVDNLVEAVQALKPEATTPETSDCCDRLIAEISRLLGPLNSAASSLAKLAEGPPALTLPPDPMLKELIDYFVSIGGLDAPLAQIIEP